MKKVLAAQVSGEDHRTEAEQGLTVPAPQGGPYQERVGIERALRASPSADPEG